MFDGFEALADSLLAHGTLAYRHTAMVLSVCLTARPAELRSLVVRIWPDDKEAVAAAVDSLLMTPFVEETAAGWRVNTQLAPVLAARFMNQDESAFREAHSILADREREALRHLTESDDDARQIDEWFVQSRLAFYLSGIHADEAVTQFGWSFESAPQQQLNSARMWLSVLVLRQARLLADYARVLAFFEGFRAYVSGRRADARGYFKITISDNQEDLYQAIALHLYAMCRKRSAERIDDLTRSVELSERLDLAENGIMARNSLSAAHLAVANDSSKSGDYAKADEHLEQALELADLNRQRASEMPQKEYLAYTLTQHATVWWNSVAGTDRRMADSAAAQEAFPDVLDELRQANEIADSAGLSEAALYELNQIAIVLRDVGRDIDALKELESALLRITPFTETASVERLRRTAGSLRDRLPAEFRPRLDRVRRGFRSAE